MKLTTLIHNGTIKKDQDIFLGTGCSFFFIGTASELRGYARMNKLSLLPRKVLDHYPRFQKDGYVVIIEGDEAGGYWFKSEYLNGRKTGGMQGYSMQHIDGLLNTREVAAKYNLPGGSANAIMSKKVPNQKIDGFLYVKPKDIEDFLKTYKGYEKRDSKYQ